MSNFIISLIIPRDRFHHYKIQMRLRFYLFSRRKTIAVGRWSSRLFEIFPSFKVTRFSQICMENGDRNLVTLPPSEKPSPTGIALAEGVTLRRPKSLVVLHLEKEKDVTRYGRICIKSGDKCTNSGPSNLAPAGGENVGRIKVLPEIVRIRIAVKV